MTRPRAFVLALLVLALVPAGTARAVTRVPEGGATGGGQGLTADVWINKEEGGVYRPGESMRVFFRSNADAYVLVYNIDTEGYIHLVYPYGPADPMRVEAGRTYIIPQRHDPRPQGTAGAESLGSSFDDRCNRDFGLFRRDDEPDLLP